VVQQFPQFNETYGIKEGDGMWLAPEDRIPVW
jgi:putative endopeptidase